MGYVGFLKNQSYILSTYGRLYTIYGLRGLGFEGHVGGLHVKRSQKRRGPCLAKTVENSGPLGSLAGF